MNTLPVELKNVITDYKKQINTHQTLQTLLKEIKKIQTCIGESNPTFPDVLVSESSVQGFKITRRCCKKCGELKGTLFFYNGVYDGEGCGGHWNNPSSRCHCD